MRPCGYPTHSLNYTVPLVHLFPAGGRGLCHEVCNHTGTEIFLLEQFKKLNVHLHLFWPVKCRLETPLDTAPEKLFKPDSRVVNIGNEYWVINNRIIHCVVTHICSNNKHKSNWIYDIDRQACSENSLWSKEIKQYRGKATRHLHLKAPKCRDQKIACDPKKLSNTEKKQTVIFPRKPPNAEIRK